MGATTTDPEQLTIELEVCDSFAKLRSRWEPMDGWRGHPALSATWLAALEDSGCVAEDVGWLPHHLALSVAGRPLAVAPAYLKLNSEGEFIFDHGIARAAPRFGVRYFPKLLVAVPFTPASGPRLLVAGAEHRAIAERAFAAALPTLCSRLEISSAHVLFLPGDDAARLERVGLAHRHTLQFHFENRGFESFEHFLSTLPQKRRTQIRRERRALSEQGIVLETLTGEGLTPEVADHAYALYLTTVDKFFWGRRYLNRAFFEQVFASMPEQIELLVAKRGRSIVAGALNLIGSDTLYGRYWGAHEEVPFLHFNVCYYHSIDRAIRDGLKRFEPGAGGEHKLARGFRPTITHSVHHFAEPRFAAVIADFFERERQAVESEVSEG